MTTGKFVSYIRVSTAKQGVSGLGMEAQREAINRYLNGGQWELLAEFVEVESGKKDDRPELLKALKHCQVTGATLVIAKLDRLSRDLHFISSLQKAGIEFLACDMPTANKFTVHIFAALAEHEREMISQRTKAALAALTCRGVKLGNPGNLSRDAVDKGVVNASAARRAKADEFAVQVGPIVRELQANGLGLRQIAARLNRQCILTARGKSGAWTPTAVKNLLARFQTTQTDC